MSNTAEMVGCAIGLNKNSKVNDIHGIFMLLIIGSVVDNLIISKETCTQAECKQKLIKVFMMLSKCTLLS